MTVLAELKALSVTTNAKNKAQASSVDLPGLIAHAEQHVVDLQLLLKQILAFHPSSGGDASNYSALQAVIAELA